MLKGITVYRLPCSRFINRCITLSAIIVCSWIGCWSVSKQATAQEKQTGSKVMAASHTAPVKMFSAPTAAPWEAIGDQSGYVKIQVSRIANHPDLKPYRRMLTSMLDSYLRSEPNPKLQTTPSIKQYGLALDDITHVQGGFWVSFNNSHEGVNAPGGVAFTFGKAELSAANPVDWPSLINALDLEKLRTNLDTDSPTDVLATHALSEMEKLREAWIKSAKKSRSNVFDTQSLLNSFWRPAAFNNNQSPSITVREVKPSATKKALWAAVSGGVATVVYDIDQVGEVPEDYYEEDPAGQANFEMTAATETAAWGVDLSQDYKTCQIRFAAVPKAGVSTDELLKHFEALRDALEQDALEHSDDLDDFSLNFLNQFKKAKVTIVNSNEGNGEMTKAYLLVEGEISADLSNVISFD